MAAYPDGETVSSYEGFDFRRLWAGRESVTRVEGELLRTALANADRSRLLEAATGFGRLSPLLAGLSEEYVGADLDPTQLGSVRDAVHAGRGRDPDLLAIANLFHLPFFAGSFATVVSVRVYHHIRDPASFLRELARVLTPGGTLVMSYTPKPTIGTLEHDVRGFLRGRPTRVTFDRRDSVECGPDPFPIVVSTRARVRRDVQDAGFEIVSELAEGPERLAPWIPTGASGDAASTFPASFLFPTRFLIARRTGRAEGGLAPLLESLACPQCRAPLAPPSLEGTWSSTCPNCGQGAAIRNRTLDARYVVAAAAERSVETSSNSAQGNRIRPSGLEGGGDGPIP
jgi:SAM-dependent methyltransferase